MAEFKGTKGTWIIKKGSEKKKWERRFYVESQNICDSCNTNNSRHICVSLESAVGFKEAEYNAKLIATAPELLDFIQEHYRYLNLDDQKKAEVLIQKATE
jgi:hypothetical protein